MLKSVVNCEELIKLDPTNVPLKYTFGRATKLVPLITTCAPKPVSPLVGLMEVIVGTGFGVTMVRVKGAEGPPPGVGLLTVICALPGAAMSEAGIWALSWFGKVTVVGLAAPLTCRTAVEAKLLPTTCIVNAAPPATTWLGLKKLIVGTG